MTKIKNILSTLLILGSSVSILGCQSTQVTPTTPEHFLVGTYTQEFSQGVYKITLDSKSNTLFNNGVMAKSVNPSYLALSKNQDWLFAATGKKSGGIDTFKWDNTSNAFTLQQQIDKLGKGTCHIALNPQETQLAVANYSSSDVYMFDIDPITKALTQKGHFKNSGTGPSKRQEKSHMHYVQWDNAGKFLYAVDLGTDEVLAFDTTSDNFIPTTATKLSAGDGPRHLAFHPTKPWVYVLNELTNSLAIFDQNVDTGLFTLKQQTSALVEPSKNNTSSAIKISEDGRFVYAGVRGINEIAVFEIDEEGAAKLIQSHTTLGDWPRDINLSPSQKHLLIANQKSGTITVLKRDTHTGILSSTDMSVDISTPSYIGVMK
jgi:6-phosphogluconolactonase